MSLYLVARLEVKYGYMAEAAEQLAKFVPVLKPYGWKLLASMHPLVGNFSEIIDIWEVPDADAVPKALAALGSGEDKEWAAVFAEFRKYVQSEHLQICAKFPFSP
jgi:hypothetical protein